MNRTSLKRYEFFDVDVLTDDIAASLVSPATILFSRSSMAHSYWHDYLRILSQGTYPSCASADGGTVVFGDKSGYVYISDQNLQISNTKHQIFRGEIKHITCLVDGSNHNRQYIVALGDDAVHWPGPFRDIFLEGERYFSSTF